MIPRLGVNIDHIATIRQARRENYPDLQQAARCCLQAGADQITIHLREDRRHIQDTDVPQIKKITQEFQRPLNLEMGTSEEIIAVALEHRPQWVCLVPEKRAELTTVGGLNLLDRKVSKKTQDACKKLQSANIQVSLFLEAKIEMLSVAAALAPNAVEIHTGEFARDFSAGRPWQAHVQAFRHAQQFLLQRQIACHGGHGMTISNVVPLLAAQCFSEFNIGHFIVAQAFFDGLDTVVQNFKKLFIGHQVTA